MNLIEFIRLISIDQYVIVLRRLDARQQVYVNIGTYRRIGEIPIIYAYMNVDSVLGFNSDGHNGLEINIS